MSPSTVSSSTVSLVTNLSTNLRLDPTFLEECLKVRNLVYSPPLSPTDTSDTLVSSPPAALSHVQKFDEKPQATARLTDFYPNAFSDFNGSGTPCVYKTGDPWPTRDSYRSLRAARPIYDHPITPIWHGVLKHIAATLDSFKVELTSINPLAYANAGEANLICDFVVSIGVKPHSLTYADAVVAGNAVHQYLAGLGYPSIQVAFVESVVHRYGPGTKLPVFDPPFDGLPALRMPFTPTLGLAIAPYKTPHFEGTGALFFRLNSNTDEVALLTCAHVTRPPPAFRDNTGITWKEGSGQRREEIIALGTGAYEKAVNDIMKFIGEKMNDIKIWKKAIERLPVTAEGESEPPKVTNTRAEFNLEIQNAQAKIAKANELHNEVTKNRTTAVRRIIGYVLHSEKIEVNVEPHNFTKDWAFVQIYREVFDWAAFKGNKLYIGGKLTPTDWLDTMYPQANDRKDYEYPPDGLLQAKGFVPEAEFHKPTNRDMHNAQTLLCFKNGRTTGPTFGRVNGLKSLTRHYNAYNIHEDSMEFIVLGHDVSTFKNTRFSDKGDSGAIVLGRDGRIIGMITGGAGSTEETDMTYITPYYWLIERIKEKYPDCYLYDIVDDD